MRSNINRWITIPSLVLWFISYSIIMLTLWASVFTFNQVAQARSINELEEKRQEWINTPAEDIWFYNDILADRDSTDENWNFTVWDELKFRSFTTVDLSVIEPDIVLPITYLDKLICEWVYDKTYKDEGFFKKSNDWSVAWTLWWIGNTFDFTGSGCHLIACQTVVRYWEPKTQCTTGEYFDILPN